MFLFYSENYNVHGMIEEEKYLELLTHLDGKAFECFFQKFYKDGMLGEDRKYFSNFKKELIDRFTKIEDVCDDISQEMDV